jgi:hypothetical protein
MASTSNKMTKALAGRLAKSKGAPVQGVIFAAIASEKLTLSSFAARAKERDREVKEKLSHVMSRIQQWEQRSGTTLPLEVRPHAAAIAVTAPADFFESLADDDSIAALDLEGGK